MFLKKINKILFDNKKIVENFSYLSALQIFGMLLPFISYPYLIRVLGANLYGTVVFVQTIISYFSILINYGFEAAGTRSISIYREDKVKLSEIVSSAYIIKFLFWILSFIVLLAIIYFTESLKHYKLLCLFSFSLTFNELLFPSWYFQGLEKMKYITIINLLTRSLFIVLIFIFIKSPSDYIYVPLLNGLGAFLGGMVAVYIIFVKDKIVFQLQPQSVIISYLKENLPLFLSNIVISVKDKFNVIFIGTFLGMRDVAVYDLGIKILNVVGLIIFSANNAIYPKVSKEQNMKYVYKFMKILFVSYLIMLILLQPILGYILDLLSGGKLPEAVTITRILLVSSLIMVVSITLARNYILAKGRNKYMFTNAIYTTVVYGLCILGGYLLGVLNNIYFYVFVTLFTYFFEMCYRIYICKYKI